MTMHVYGNVIAAANKEVHTALSAKARAIQEVSPKPSILKPENTAVNI